MRSSFFELTLVATVILSFGLMTTDGPTQDIAPAPAPAPALEPAAPDETSEALKRLATQFAERRAVLNERRQALAHEHDLLMAVDRPAGEAELSRWRDRNATGDRLQRDIETLRGLIEALTPETLKAMSLPEGSAGRSLKPDPGLWRTIVEVNVRAAPEASPFVALKAGALVVHLASDSAGGWSLVATPQGIGFVPVSQLRQEP